jgi:hypothetical protein
MRMPSLEMVSEAGIKPQGDDLLWVGFGMRQALEITSVTLRRFKT